MKNLICVQYVSLILCVVILNINCNTNSNSQTKKLSTDSTILTAPVPGEDLRAKFKDYSPSSLGRSINSATGNLGGYVVSKNIRDSNYSYKLDSINEATSETNIFSSLESFVESYSLDIDASVKYGAFEGSLNLSKSKDHVFNQYQQYIVFHAKTKKSHISLTNFTFDSSLISDSKKDAKRFLLAKGDEFVSGADIGGELFIIINIENSNQQDAERSRLQVQESFNNLSVSQSAHADIKKCVEQIQKVSKTHINIIASGLDASNYNFADVESSTKFMEDYNNNISKGGTVLQFYTSKISDLDGCPSELSDPSNLMFINDKKSVLLKIENLINQINLQLPILGYVLNDTANFKADIPLATELNSLDNKNIITLRQNWKNCSVDTLDNDSYWEKSKLLAPRPFTPKNPPLFEETHDLEINTNTNSIALIPPNKTVHISIKGMVRFDSSLTGFDLYPISPLLDGNTAGHGDFGGVPRVLIEIREYEWNDDTHKWNESPQKRELEPAGGKKLPDGSIPNEWKSENKRKMLTARLHLMLVSNGWSTDYYKGIRPEDEIIDDHVHISPEKAGKLTIFVRE